MEITEGISKFKKALSGKRDSISQLQAQEKKQAEPKDLKELHARVQEHQDTMLDEFKWGYKQIESFLDTILSADLKRAVKAAGEVC